MQVNRLTFKFAQGIAAFWLFTLTYSPFSFAEFPKDLSRLVKVGYLSGGIEGSGGVFVLQDPYTGKKYVFKAGINKETLQEEIMADALTAAFGAPVPAFEVYHDIPPALANEKISQHHFYRLSEYIDGVQLYSKNLPPDRQDLALKKVVEHFAVDALMSGWDTIKQGKNIVVTQDNIPYRVDNGGSLRLRALGDPKAKVPGWDPYHVTDLDSLRDPKLNPDGAVVYGDISNEEIKKQIHEILKHRKSALETLTRTANKIHLDTKSRQEIEKMIQSRLDHYALMIGEKPWSMVRAAEPATNATGAGVLAYAIKDGVPHVLLARRAGNDVTRYNGTWSNFGGKSDSTASHEHVDHTLADTASREVFEESVGLIHLSPQILNQSPSFDLVPNPLDDSQREDPVINKLLYRTYFAPITYRPEAEFFAAMQQATQAESREYTDFIWIPVDKLLKVARDPDMTGFEFRRKTAKGEKREYISLYPPLIQTLKNPFVISYLAQIQEGKKPLPYHAQGIYKDSWPLKENDIPNLSPRWRSPDNASNLEAKEEATEKVKADGGKHRPVPFDQDARHHTMSIRTWLTGKKELHSETVRYDPQENQRILAQAVAQHGLVMSELKKKRGQKDQPEQILLPKLPDQERKEIEKIRQDMIRAPYTQTEGYMKHVMKEDYQEISPEMTPAQVRETARQNIEKFLLNPKISATAGCFVKAKEEDKQKHTNGFNAYVDTLTNALLHERENKGKVVFYFGTASYVAFIFDFISELRKQLIIGDRDQTFVRALDEAFADYPTLADFIKGFELDGVVDNHVANYADMGLSVNPFLMGNGMQWGECSYWYFFNSYSWNPPNFTLFYNHLKRRLGLRENVNKLNQIFHRYLSADFEKRGRLLQIFVDPLVVDQMTYSSVADGDVIRMDMGEQKEYYGSLKVLQYATRYPEKLDEILATQKSKEEKMNSQQFQSRIYMHPHYFYHPDLTQIVSYERPDVDLHAQRKAKAELQAFVKNEVGNLLSSQIDIPPETILADLKMRKLYDWVQKGSTGIPVTYQPVAPTLGEWIEQNKMAEVQDYLNRHPDFDLAQPIPTRHTPRSQTGLPPIEVALRSGHFEMASLLLKHVPEEKRKIVYKSLNPDYYNPSPDDYNQLIFPEFYQETEGHRYFRGYILRNFDKLNAYPELKKLVLDAAKRHQQSVDALAAFYESHPDQIDSSEFIERLSRASHSDVSEKEAENILSLARQRFIKDEAVQSIILDLVRDPLNGNVPNVILRQKLIDFFVQTVKAEPRLFYPSNQMKAMSLCWYGRNMTLLPLLETLHPTSEADKKRVKDALEYYLINDPNLRGPVELRLFTFAIDKLSQLGQLSPKIREIVITDAVNYGDTQDRAAIFAGQLSNFNESEQTNILDSLLDYTNLISAVRNFELTPKTTRLLYKKLARSNSYVQDQLDFKLIPWIARDRELQDEIKKNGFSKEQQRLNERLRMKFLQFEELHSNQCQSIPSPKTQNMTDIANTLQHAVDCK